MFLSAASFDKENAPCLNKEYDQGIQKDDFMCVTTRKLRSIIKNNTLRAEDRTDKMAPGTVHLASQSDNRSQGKVVLGLLPDDPKLKFKHMPRAPSIEKNKPTMDRNLLRRQRRVSFESSPPQTLTGSDVHVAGNKNESEIKDENVNEKPEGNSLDSNEIVENSDRTTQMQPDALPTDTYDSAPEQGQITREGTFTLSDSGEKSWNEDIVCSNEADVPRAKSASSHCSTCTCRPQSPASPKLKNRTVVPQHSTEKHKNCEVTEICADVDKISDTSRSPSSLRPVSRSAKTRIPKLTEERRKINSAKSRGVSHEANLNLHEISPGRSVVNTGDKKSVLKRINQLSAWEDVEEGLVPRNPDNRLKPIHKISAVRSRPESYAISLNGRRDLSLEAEPCPSCSEVHGKTSLQVDGEAERLPNPAELLLKIRRKHLRKRNLTDSVATFVKECKPEGGSMTSRSEISGDKTSSDTLGNLTHRRAVTDTTHLEQLKENVTLSLKRCTLTSANARMLGEDAPSAFAFPQNIPHSAAVSSKSDRLAAITHGEDDDMSMNKTYTLTNYDQFLQMAKIHKQDTKSFPNSTPAKQFTKPLLNKRQVLALDFTKLENETPPEQPKADDSKMADVSGANTQNGACEIGTLDTSMADIINDIPKCNRLPPISPVSKTGQVKVRVKVTPRSKSKKRNPKLKEYDIKSIKRIEDLPPLVREELKNKARLRLKQLTSPIQSKDIERNH
ncbi:uncharacterized protein LOC135502092 [Lineus longissimus]|uniref:uncharacterized protein LOC135502092 n=1 Tax=Lineus longissimus TaxID=88925 RepID=UPI00315CCCCF